MKKQVCLIYCLGLLICSISQANLSGSDDFNDNVMNPAKWSVLFGDSLTETNSRLEYSGGDGAWIWELNSGSYAHDWTISLDAFNSVDKTTLSDQEISLGFLAYNKAPNDDLFSMDFKVGDDVGGANRYRLIETSAEQNNVEVLNHQMSLSITSARLQISFDASAKVFTSYYDSGSGLTALTSYNAGSWGMTDSDVFTIAVFGFSTDVSPASGEVFADNFAAIPEPSTLGLLAIAAGGIVLARHKKCSSMPWR